MKPTTAQIGATLTRYTEFVSRQLMRTRWAGEAEMRPHYDAREKWITARRVYLEALLHASKKEVTW